MKLHLGLMHLQSFLFEVQPIEALFHTSVCYFDYRKSFFQPVVGKIQLPIDVMAYYGRHGKLLKPDQATASTRTKIILTI